MKKTALVLLMTPLALTSLAQQKKNLVIVMADQWRGDALGFLERETPVQTPNLDKFSKIAVSLNQCISGYPVSSPARAMFLTGAYPKYNGVTTNCNSNSAEYGVEMHTDIETWSDVLHDQGYKMGYIGKWHLDAPYEPFIDTYNNKGGNAWNEWCPPERRHGFIDYWVAYGTYDNHMKPMYWNNPTSRDDWEYQDQWGPEFEVDRAMEFIDKNKKDAFAVMVSMNPPHTGYNLVPQKYKDIYKDLNVDSIVMSRPNITNEKYFRNSIADYYACMTGVDDQFGRLIDYLEKEGLMENTIVVFTSDHGDMMGIHDVIGKNVIYEESVRVPFLIAGAGIEPRQDEELLFSLEDFAPTILSMLGYSELIPNSFQTRDLSRQVLGQKSKMPTSQLYMRMWSWGKDNNAVRGIRNLQYSYVAQWVDGEIVNEMLFDRLSDPFQLKNIAEESEKVCKKLRKELLKRLKANGDNIYEVNHNKLFDFDVRNNYIVGEN